MSKCQCDYGKIQKKFRTVFSRIPKDLQTESPGNGEIPARRLGYGPGVGEGGAAGVGSRGADAPPTAGPTAGAGGSTAVK